jgi:carbon-monoxide dehydrogenase large subunit
MAKFALGQSLTRLEDLTLVRGAGSYTDDVGVTGAAHAFFLRSPHAHAAIRSIDVGAARRSPGVLAVLTGADVAADGLGEVPCLVPVKNVDGTDRGETPRPVLAQGRVRHVGDPIALVVAETLGQAKDAADLIAVEYDILPAVAEVRSAVAADAPRVWDAVAGNVCFHVAEGSDRKAVDAAFVKAAHVTRIELVNNRIVANPLEPRSAIAAYDEKTGRTTLYTPTQGPHVIYDQLAGVLKVDKAALRVVSGQVGGGFGMKIFLHPEQPAVVWAARRLQRGVRWTSDRSEGFLSDAQGRDNFSIAELALDGEHRFLAMRVTTLANMGAYLSNFGPFIPQLALPMLTGVYRIPLVAAEVKGILSNTVPVDAYRGAGRPEASYLVERLVDLAAREVGLPAEDLRRRNFIRPEEMPWKTPVNTEIDSGEFERLMDMALANADWKGFAERREASARRGKLRGRGMAMYIERCGGGNAHTIAFRVDEQGEATVYTGMHDNGQGHVTTLVQLVSDRLQVDSSRVKVVMGDTDRVPGGMTGGSRFGPVAGVATRAAVDDVIKQGRDVAATMLEAAAQDIEYRDGEFRVVGTDRKVMLDAVAAKAGGLAAENTFDPKGYTFPNGCHVCEIEIDRETGALVFERYTVVDDFGYAINPILLAGQVHGGTVQGIGPAVLENTVYDATGQLLTGSFSDYAMPRADDMPSFRTDYHHVPTGNNPLGVKGAGEAGAVAAPATVINAIVDALAQVSGPRHIDMPATRERIWRAMSAGR